jgi:drug/metabolite transporter (DMT)-like permease
MELLSTLGLLYNSVIWGSTFFVVRDAVRDLHPVTLVAYRFLLSGLLLLPIVLAKRDIKRDFVPGFVLGLFLVSLYISQTWGLKYTTASNSGFITGLFVLFVPLFQLLFFKVPVGRNYQFGAVMAVAGLWILTGGIKHLNIGDMLTVFGSVSYALHLIYVEKYLKKKADMLLMIFHQFWIVGIICLLISLTFGLDLNVHSRSAANIVVFLAIFPTLSAFFIQIWAQKRVTAVRASLIFSLEPAFAALFAWTMGGEKMTTAGLIGGLVIMCAIFIGEFAGKKNLPIHEN